MAYAVVHDIACSWYEYERVWEELLEPLPPGLLVHVAGPTDEGVRLIHIWAGDHAGTDAQPDRLTTVIANIRRRTASRDFRPVHLLINEQASRNQSREEVKHEKK